MRARDACGASPGLIAELLLGGTFGQAIRFGFSLLVWGIFVRTVVHWHLTWAVNSVSHLWGYRNYETSDGSRNNAFVGILIGGEGWHNNHHADPRSARHGHKWWELDISWLTIRSLMAIGLARDVVMPSTSIAEALQLRAKRADNQRDRATEPSRPGNMLGWYRGGSRVSVWTRVFSAHTHCAERRPR